MHLGEQWNTL